MTTILIADDHAVFRHGLASLLRERDGWQVSDFDDSAWKTMAVPNNFTIDDPSLATQLRYFEVAPGGWTTLERHEHVHNVMVIRGRGRALIGDQVHALAQNDLVSVPPLTWHQFHAAPDEPLGFLCLVDRERDRPQLPSAQEAAALAKPLLR